MERLKTSKKSFLVYRMNKYLSIPTEKIAFFYIRYESACIVCFDRQEYQVNYSLDQLQEMLAKQHFFRANRQYLVSFSAVREVEHFFARKLIVTLVIPAGDKLIVSREKATSFLRWLDNR